jgi:ubiquinone/menaquinone biosynthesis C-methylase UbiE
MSSNGLDPTPPLHGIPRLWRWMLAVVRWSLRHLYTTFAFSYDGVAWLVSAGHWRQWQQVGLDACQPGPLLELGHGPGHLLKARLAAGLPATGIDLSRQMSRKAGKRLGAAGLAKSIARAEAQALPFAGRSFATALATFPTEYAFDPRTAREVMRVLKPGGCLVMVPGIQVTGRGPVALALRGLYAITGEQPQIHQPWLDVYKRLGFDMKQELIPAAGALVLRLIWTSPGQPSASDVDAPPNG